MSETWLHGIHRPPIVITAQDHSSLLTLLSSVELDQVSTFLKQELERADVVDQELPGTFVARMGSEITYFEHHPAKVRQVRLVYPDQADGNHFVSVLSPLGSALIGLGPGQMITWTENELERRLTVLEVAIPQRSGSETLAEHPQAATTMAADAS